MGVRTTGTRRRANLRRGARMCRLRNVITSLTCLVDDVGSSGGSFGAFAVDFEKQRVAIGHGSCGDLVPIPPIDEELVASPYSCASPFISEVTKLVNFTLAGIDYMYGGFRAINVPNHASGIQRSAQ